MTARHLMTHVSAHRRRVQSSMAYLAAPGSSRAPELPPQSTESRGDTYGACFTADCDCDYVSFDGSRTQDHTSVIDSHDRLFRGVLVGSARVGKVKSIRHVSEDVALLYGTGSVLGSLARWCEHPACWESAGQRSGPRQ